MLWKSEQQHGTAGTIRFRLNPVTLMPHFLSPSFLFNPDSQLNDCVTASALHFQMRGWILAERTLCSKGKFKGGRVPPTEDSQFFHKTPTISKQGCYRRLEKFSGKLSQIDINHACFGPLSICTYFAHLQRFLRFTNRKSIITLLRMRNIHRRSFAGFGNSNIP